ncbi:MAG: hypothetical protein JWM05_153 [Acidimicrobiales bacterium]|nr:hypothetical protein [Acidimicrobiales bacterium]
MIEDDPKTGPADVTHILTEAMERAGVHPAYVFAVRRCGFVLTEENADSFDAEQVARWNAAVDAWYDERAAGAG